MERRVVTAFFIDVVGSTALTVQLGPERFKRALDQAFLELRTIIDGEQGTVANTIGDAIFALFGTPAAHSDDPQRALRAAQACIRWAEMRGGAPVPLAVRIGLETGEVIVDLTAEREGQQTSIGTCVNLAARLQQLAAPGQVLVGPTCHQVAAELAAFAPLGEVELKGLGRQAVWRLVAIGEPAGRALPPLIGRTSELARLKAAYRRVRSGRSILAIVSGPPGQGKTRLVEEFLAAIGAKARILQARCRPVAERAARNPLRELLASDGAGGSAEALAARLADLFSDPLERDRVSAALAHSAGMIVSHELATLPADQRQDEVENGWRRYLAALTRDRPLVVWVDDAHWGEPEIVRMLERITLGASLPLLVIATARPAFAAQARLRAGVNRLFVSLDALEASDAWALARHAGSIDPAGIERAEGNPLFIIELSRARSMSATPEVPITLKGIIGARLDELSRQDRALLQCVAVVGETFTASDAALLSGREPADVASALDRLVAIAYLRPVQGGLRFHHALVHDVAYGRLATAERLQLHAHYARYGVPADDAETLAHHLWEAVGGEDAEWVWEGSEELSRVRSHAREAHLAASRRYADRFAYERAIEACRRAALFAIDPEDVGQVEQTIGDVFAAKGDADQAWAHFMRARQCYLEAGHQPPADLYASFLELPVYNSGMFLRPPDEALVEALLREGEGVARGAGDAASMARLLALRAYQSFDVVQLTEALRVSETVVDPTALGSILGHAGTLQNRVGDFAAARQSYERLDALAPLGAATDRQHEFRAILALNIGRLEEAEGLAAQFLASSASRGPHLRTHAYREQCHVLLAQGYWRGLRELAADTERLVSEHPETAFCYAVTTALAFAAVASAIEGEDMEARALLSRAEAPLQAEPFERESVLLLANGALGLSDKVDELRGMTRQRNATPLWYFDRMDAVVLTMLERWDEVDEVLPRLERVAAQGNSRYVAALVAGVREEMTAARGGAAATHRMLRELGYRGWSRLLAYRPAAGDGGRAA
ncbi:adenylate cyclase [Aliidongia dinghuensis]|uniref:Adenylate cyclase n=1 Tax=Aliidongia dinghuensis TaxID=1867774 RepID=A0A8J2YYY7_9PROT|nr:adenylate/guanylate cyclase domain-containing protein [Aliidongia dinghuensis]GGF40784.1 adenylate cyclase [Aliidongia dinghuensis]